VAPQRQGPSGPSRLWSYVEPSGVGSTAPHVSDGTSREPWENPRAAVALLSEGQVALTRLTRQQQPVPRGEQRRKQPLPWHLFVLPVGYGDRLPGLQPCDSLPRRIQSSPQYHIAYHISIILLRRHNASRIARMKIFSTTRTATNLGTANGEAKAGRGLSMLSAQQLAAT